MRYSGLALSAVSPYPISHDSISRWLHNKCFRPRDLWEIAHKHVDSSEPSLLICDDTVLAKTRSQKIELVNYQYSGNAHDVIAGIGLINLLWHGLENESSVPIDYRIYDKDTDGKTKNTHFCDMLSLAKSRGVNPTAVVMDAWYSSLDNLKAIRSHGWIWVTTLRKNRVVNRDKRLENLDIPKKDFRFLAEWANKNDIQLLFTQPGNPQQNAYVERYNRTVRYDWLNQYLFATLEEVQEFATQWLWSYNNERPNMAIGGITPKQKLALVAA